jgi:uncharacterized protein YjbJ (UPF0337 family)
MGTQDKVNNKVEDLVGRGKEAAGAVTNDEELRQEGRADQAQSAVHQAAETVKDAAGDVAAAAKKIVGK